MTNSVTIRLYIYRLGHKMWYKNGLRHRINGYAIESKDGKRRYWYIDDVEYTYLEYLIEIEQLNANK